MPPDRNEAPVSRQLWRLFRIWLLLILLGAAEFGASSLALPSGLRPLLMLLGMLMILAVAWGFMEVHRGGVLVRAFAVAALFWLLVLLGLGSADPVTRTVYRVPSAQVK